MIHRVERVFSDRVGSRLSIKKYRHTYPKITKCIKSKIHVSYFVIRFWLPFKVSDCQNDSIEKDERDNVLPFSFTFPDILRCSPLGLNVQFFPSNEINTKCTFDLWN